MKSQYYTIKEVSSFLGIPSSTLRYYEDEQLLTNVKRDEHGKRLYTKEQIGRLQTICCFKNAGMPISSLKEFFSYREDNALDIRKIQELLQKHQKHLTFKIVELNKGLIHIEKKIRFYAAIHEALEQGQPRPSWDEYK